MAFGDGEVVNIARPRQHDRRRGLQLSGGRDEPHHRLVAHLTKAPDPAVGLEAGVREEGRVGEVVPQGDDPLRFQGSGIDLEGGARLPQGPELVAPADDADVGGVDVIGGADVRAGTWLRAEAPADHGVGGDVGAALGRVHEPCGEARPAVLDLKGADQAVAVEPVGRLALGPAELGPAVAIERARQPLRRLAADALHGPGRKVGLEIGEGDLPVRGHRHTGLRGGELRRQGRSDKSGGAGHQVAAARLEMRRHVRGPRP